MSSDPQAGEQRTCDGRDYRQSWKVPSRPFVIAHRFGNTLPALAQAANTGVTVVEADVWLHRGRVEVRHSKTAGPLPILWDRWSLEPGWAPRLELSTLLDHLPPQMTLMLDIKGRSPYLPHTIMRLIRSDDWDRPLLVCSQNWTLLEAFRQYPEAILVHSIGNRRQLIKAWQRLENDDHDMVSIHVRLLDRETVRALKDRVSVVITWPINDGPTARKVLDWGVDGLTTDVPSRLLSGDAH